MLRPMLGAVVIAAGLSAALAQAPSVLLVTADAVRSAAAAAQPSSCADTDGDREWNPRRDHAGSTIESTWKWRSLYVAFAASARRATVDAVRTETPARPRAPAAPAHLQDIPLLI